MVMGASLTSDVVTDTEAAEVHPHALAGDAALHGKQQVVPRRRHNRISRRERRGGERPAQKRWHGLRPRQPQHALPLRVRVRRERRAQQIHAEPRLPLPHREHHLERRPILDRRRRQPENRRPERVVAAANNHSRGQKNSNNLERTTDADLHFIVTKFEDRVFRV